MMDRTVTSSLPDVSATEVAPTAGPLEWVGMEGIDVPILLVEPGYRRIAHARADAQVDLPAANVKGIHMSRLYRLLDAIGEADALSPTLLQSTLRNMIDSHRDCDSRNAWLRFRFDLLARRPALVTDNLAGWKSYPVCLDAALIEGQFRFRLDIKVTYSSTCPCSAALSRQLVEQGFLSAFANQQQVDTEVVAAWLRQNASLATPHSQRSEADIAIDLPEHATDLGLLTLIDRVEQALGTPVQTAVKRADEQAFAALNGQNLMFVEDAARRLRTALNDHHANATVQVRHLESLHPHDAVAFSGSIENRFND